MCFQDSTATILQALSSPVSGILGDKYDRTHIVAFGCCLWGVMTAFIGLSSSIHQVTYAQAALQLRIIAFTCMQGCLPARRQGLQLLPVLLQAMIWCGINGIGLALVIPCVQSLIADYHPPETRGQAFGIMFFTSGLGTLRPTRARGFWQLETNEFGFMEL